MNNFKKGDYIVLLEGSNYKHMPDNYCYKLSEDYNNSNFVIEKDMDNYKNNGWNGKFVSTLKFRPASLDEIEYYDQFNKPYDIYTLNQKYIPKIGDYIFFLKTFDATKVGSVVRINRVESDKPYGDYWITYEKNEHINGGFRIGGNGYYLNKDFRKALPEEISNNEDKLPEKWCFKGKSQEFVDWANENNQIRSVHTLDEITYNYFHYPKVNNIHTCFKIKLGYVPITIQQFKKWVLKQSINKQQVTNNNEYKENNIKSSSNEIRSIEVSGFNIQISTTSRTRGDSIESSGSKKSCGIINSSNKIRSFKSISTT